MSKKIFTIVVLLMVGVLSGCGSNTAIREKLNFAQNAGAVKYKIAPVTHDKISKKVDPAIISRVEMVLSDILRKQNMLQSESSQNAYVVNIDVVGYRTKHGSLRFFTGMMSGKEYIQSVVTVRDNQGKSIGQADINTYNLTAYNTLGGEHAKGIAEFLMQR